MKVSKVKARLAGFVWVKCQAERLNDAATTETLVHFGVKGLPTYVVLKPGPGGGGPARRITGKLAVVGSSSCGSWS